MKLATLVLACSMLALGSCGGSRALPLGKVAVLPADAACTGGIQDIRVGIDADDSGALDAGEVSAGFTRCLTSAAQSATVVVSRIDAGDPRCVDGGIAFDVSEDAMPYSKGVVCGGTLTDEGAGGTRSLAGFRASQVISTGSGGSPTAYLLCNGASRVTDPDVCNIPILSLPSAGGTATSLGLVAEASRVGDAAASATRAMIAASICKEAALQWTIPTRDPDLDAAGDEKTRLLEFLQRVMDSIIRANIQRGDTDASVGLIAGQAAYWDSATAAWRPIAIDASAGAYSSLQCR